MPTVHRHYRKLLSRKRGALIILMICRFLQYLQQGGQNHSDMFDPVRCEIFQIQPLYGG